MKLTAGLGALLVLFGAVVGLMAARMGFGGGVHRRDANFFENMCLGTIAVDCVDPPRLMKSMAITFPRTDCDRPTMFLMPTAGEVSLPDGGTRPACLLQAFARGATDR